jgi:hypothetical protein
MHILTARATALALTQTLKHLAINLRQQVASSQGQFTGRECQSRDLGPQASHFHTMDTGDSFVVSCLRGPHDLQIEFTAGYPSYRFLRVNAKTLPHYPQIWCSGARFIQVPGSLNLGKSLSHTPTLICTSSLASVLRPYLST